MDTLAFSLRPQSRFGEARRWPHPPPAKARERPLAAAHWNVEVGGSGGRVEAESDPPEGGEPTLRCGAVRASLDGS